ncbi:hypothetical protein [Alsobacter sp. R-9]
MLTSDEVARHLSGSLKLLNQDTHGLDRFNVSLEAFWHSFLAVFLTAPAFVAVLASDRVRLGLPLQEGLFHDPELVLVRLIAAGAAWVAFPLLMILVVRALGLGHRYVGYIIVYNWSAVVTTTAFAIPAAAYALGFIPSGVVILFGIGFSIVVFHYRWFMTRAALGVSGGLAAVLAAGDLGLSTLVSAAARAIV